MKWFARTPKPRNLRYTRFWDYFFILVPAVLVALPAVGMLLVTPTIKTTAIEDFKEVLLAFSTGIITLTAVYVGAALQNQREREKALHQIRHETTKQYREYILDLMRIGKRWELQQQVGGYEEQQFLDITNQLIDALPPTEEFSAIDDPTCSQAVDQAIKEGLNYWMYQYDPDKKPSREDLRKIYRTALTQLDFYASGL